MGSGDTSSADADNEENVQSQERVCKKRLLQQFAQLFDNRLLGAAILLGDFHISLQIHNRRMYSCYKPV